MAVAHSKEFVLELLGKEVSFDLILSDELRQFSPEGISQTGRVESVLIDLSGDHQILVDNEFYSIALINMN